MLDQPKGLFPGVLPAAVKILLIRQRNTFFEHSQIPESLGIKTVGRFGGQSEANIQVLIEKSF
jgi:hypothetical protein